MSYDRDKMKKKQMWRAYWEGYKQAYNVESMKPVAERAARTKFKRWFNSEEE